MLLQDLKLTFGAGYRNSDFTLQGRDCFTFTLSFSSSTNKKTRTASYYLQNLGLPSLQYYSTCRVSSRLLTASLKSEKSIENYNNIIVLTTLDIKFNY